MQLQATGKLAVPRNYVKGGEKKNTERIAHPAFDLETNRDTTIHFVKMLCLQLLYDLNLNRKNGFVFFLKKHKHLCILTKQKNTKLSIKVFDTCHCVYLLLSLCTKVLNKLTEL